MSWSLVETCAGSAALTVHLLGSQHALLPYQGSKWKVRNALERLLQDSGLKGPPSTVWLNDPGPFGRTWSAMVADPETVAVLVEDMDSRDPRELYAELHGALVPLPEPALDATFAAQHLFLQRLSHSGKAVAVRDGRWVSPGFNSTSAYGTEGTDKFGPVRPVLPHLCRTIRLVGEALRGARVVSTSHDVRSFWHGRHERTPFHELLDGGDPVAFLVDPPYRGTPGYGSGDSKLERGDVVRLSEQLLLAEPERPSLVLVCEAEPVEIRGALIRELKESTEGGTPLRPARREVATWACSKGWPFELPRRAFATTTGVVAPPKSPRSKRTRARKEATT